MALRQGLVSRGLDDKVEVKETGCIGTCDLGPVVVVNPGGYFYEKVHPEDVDEIIQEHIMEGRPVQRLHHCSIETGLPQSQMKDMDFYNRQKKIALRNCGVIDPMRIADYAARGGYKALEKALKTTPQEVIDTLKSAGLRGRGGAGFPTGLKWELTAKAQGNPKYVVCNADEGDPGAFMDRSILEGDPHSLIEAMVIAAYAIGAEEGYIYVRAEYPLAIEHMGIALEQARGAGYIGKGIMGSELNFDLEIRVGAGAFVCGEETALLASIEGHRGMPRPKPPFPAQKGLWDSPTLINNVETYANVPFIILEGPEAFASVGTGKSKGTKVFALAGKINTNGLVEVPMGTPLREIVETIGGGIPGGKRFKAAQIGGPSGGCIPAQHFDASMDYETLVELGAMMGSGGLIILDEDTCMVDIARFFLQFTQDESCGKCIPCREGTKAMLEILERITSGKGREGDIELLESLGNTIKKTALCGLGQTAPNPVLSTIKYFRDEYEAHIKRKACPAGVCLELVRYEVVPDVCRRCGLCIKTCPVGAIYEVEPLEKKDSGEKKGAGKKALPRIDQDKCTKCGACVVKCPFNAIRNAK